MNISKKELRTAAQNVVQNAAQVTFFEGLMKVQEEVDKWARCYNAFGEEKVSINVIRNQTRKTAKMIIDLQRETGIQIVRQFYLDKTYLSIRDCLNVVEFTETTLRVILYASANKISVKEASFELASAMSA